MAFILLFTIEDSPQYESYLPETKCFDYRILGVNHLLLLIKLSDPLYSFCSVEHEILLHLFHYCNYVKKFWEEYPEIALEMTVFSASDICFDHFANIHHLPYFSHSLR